MEEPPQESHPPAPAPVVVRPELTDEQKARGCRIEGDRIICPPQQTAKIENGTVEATIGRQKVTTIVCRPVKKGSDKLRCTTTSTER